MEYEVKTRYNRLWHQCKISLLTHEAILLINLTAQFTFIKTLRDI